MDNSFPSELSLQILVNEVQKFVETTDFHTNKVEPSLVETIGVVGAFRIFEKENNVTVMVSSVSGGWFLLYIK